MAIEDKIIYGQKIEMWDYKNGNNIEETLTRLIEDNRDIINIIPFEYKIDSDKNVLKKAIIISKPNENYKPDFS
jgi:hypothetical protein